METCTLILSISIVAEIGDFSAFTKPKQLVAYFGTGPNVKESWKFKGIKSKMSKGGSTVSRHVFLASIRHNRKVEANNPVLRNNGVTPQSHIQNHNQSLKLVV